MECTIFDIVEHHWILIIVIAAVGWVLCDVYNGHGVPRG